MSEALSQHQRNGGRVARARQRHQTFEITFTKILRAAPAVGTSSGWRLDHEATVPGKESTPNDSPTLYETDRDTLLVQGYVVRPGVTAASRICPAAAMPSRPVAASAVTWCLSDPWWRRTQRPLGAAATSSLSARWIEQHGQSDAVFSLRCRRHSLMPGTAR
jgi:hypothetical protein